MIPKAIRDETRLEPGAEVSFEPVEDGVIVRRAQHRPGLRGRFAGSGMADRLLEDRDREPR